MCRRSTLAKCLLVAFVFASDHSAAEQHSLSSYADSNSAWVNLAFAALCTLGAQAGGSLVGVLQLHRREDTGVHEILSGILSATLVGLFVFPRRSAFITAHRVCVSAASLAQMGLMVSVASPRGGWTLCCYTACTVLCMLTYNDGPNSTAFLFGEVAGICCFADYLSAARRDCHRAEATPAACLLCLVPQALLLCALRHMVSSVAATTVARDAEQQRHEDAILSAAAATTGLGHAAMAVWSIRTSWAPPTFPSQAVTLVSLAQCLVL